MSDGSNAVADVTVSIGVVFSKISIKSLYINTCWIFFFFLLLGKKKLFALLVHEVTALKEFTVLGALDAGVVCCVCSQH